MTREETREALSKLKNAVKFNFKGEEITFTCPLCSRRSKRKTKMILEQKEFMCYNCSYERGYSRQLNSTTDKALNNRREKRKLNFIEKTLERLGERAKYIEKAFPGILERFQKGKISLEELYETIGLTAKDSIETFKLLLDRSYLHKKLSETVNATHKKFDSCIDKQTRAIKNILP